MKQPISPTPVTPGREIAQLLAGNAADTTRFLAECSLDEQAALVCSAPLGRRAELLQLTPMPEQVIPLLPEAELCYTVKEIGLQDAGWALACASTEQLIAAVDLDIWEGFAPEPAKLDTWLDALAHAGDATLLRGVQELDTELIFLYLKNRIASDLKPPDSESCDDWQPPIGGQTLDGQFYYCAVNEKDDLETITRMLKLLFTENYWLYFRLLQAVIHEPRTENEEFAMRWRNGRLEDLGFPAWEEAMAIYGHLRPDERSALPGAEDVDALDISAWRMPVWAPELPAELTGSEHAIFRAVAQLDAEGRAAFFYALIGLANKVAVADKLPLGDAESLPQAIAKAAALTSAGFEYLAAEHPLPAAELLHRVRLDHLYRIGANLQRSA